MSSLRLVGRSNLPCAIGVADKQMKPQSIIWLAILSAAPSMGGCKADGTGPSHAVTSGTAIVDTRYVNSQLSGFSFDQASVIRFPNSAGILPDLIALVQTNETGTILGVFFGRPDSILPAFRLLLQFATLDSAEAYFRRLTEIPDTTYTDVALVRAAQIWAIKTRRNNYAKILIRVTLAYADSSGSGAPALYGEATFDWVYQPNGTRRF